MNKRIRLGFLLLFLMLLATGLMPQNGSKVRAFDACQDCYTACAEDKVACIQAGRPLSLCNYLYATCLEENCEYVCGGQ